MNELQIINHDGVLVTDSREVAQMIEKRHDHLLRDIDGYVEILSKMAAPKIGVSNFFIESSYQDSTGRKLPCYLITKKGCDMVANKMTGEKGVIFTATYINKFYEMEQLLKDSQPRTQIQVLAAIAQQMAEQEQLALEQSKQLQTLEVAQAENAQQVQNIKEALLPSDKEWRKSINERLNKISRACDLDYRGVRENSYEILERRAACSLSRRVKNIKNRLSEGGATKTSIEKACKLDAIEADQRLKEIYSSIVREMVVKYVA